MSDFSLTTFAARGKLPQIENALAAVAKGETSLGIKAKNGVVIATEKKLSSPLMDESSYAKTQILCDHIGAVYSGLGPDFRLLAQKSRKLVQNYFVKYFEPVGVPTLCRETSELLQEKTQAGGYRPFGVSVLIAGYDETGPHLTQLDPSGAYYNWKATAIGKSSKNAKVFLEKRYKADMEIEDAIHTALMTLKEGFEGEMSSTNIEVGVIREDRKFQVLTPAQIKEYLDELN
jgi:20S proteasome subunit alpha 2